MSPEFQQQRRMEVYRLHHKYNRCNFDGQGNWVGSDWGRAASFSREMLWHSIAFLAGDKDDIELGNRIIQRTPNVRNHFCPVVGADIWLRYQDCVEEESINVLRAMILDGFPEAIDFGLAVRGLDNFSAMHAFFFLAASQLMDTYEVTYEHRSIPEVYNEFRMRQFGLNILRLIECQLERTKLSNEFNSPNYSPITLWALSEIVNLINFEPAVKLAERIQFRLWKEVLSFHHPLLHHVSGPYSRGYSVDSVGHGSLWKVLCCFLGIDGQATVGDILYPPQAGQLVNFSGDATCQQSIACWLIRPDYHVPLEILEQFNRRTFPFEYAGNYEWRGDGFRRADGSVVLNVEGDVLIRDGMGIAKSYQADCFSIGSMSESYGLQNHPCQIIYKLTEEAKSLGGTRSISTVMLIDRLPEQVNNAMGENVSPEILPNAGHFLTEQYGSTVKGTVEPYKWIVLCRDNQSCDEISFNLFISEHLPVNTPVEFMSLNEQVYNGQDIEVNAKQATVVVEDGSVKVRCMVRTEDEVCMRVGKYGEFLRFSVLLYNGPLKRFTAEELSGLSVGFEIRVETR